MDNNFDKQTQDALINKNRMRRMGFIAAGIGLGSALAYLISRVFVPSERVQKRAVPEHIVDDRGTDQDKAARILLRLRDRAFESSDEKLAIALGRPVEEVNGWNAGVEVIDDDVVMKARGIAMARGVTVE
ncbi:MAG TPA: hypothetical protein VJU86_10910 [Pyrinomonadaceae bacterium]|nr:hypothetical protein [Pyrinomonadaceae bacterium]